jgi:hypothetical protein
LCFQPVHEKLLDEKRIRAVRGHHQSRMVL